ncbi:MAG: hypothetical protein HUU57_16295 [Bdellovibrio sp.]|nr:hypothetical protein [Bdellovibrio sp.]
MSTDQEQVTESDVFKAIGHLEEATKTMVDDAAAVTEDEEKIAGFLAFVGRIIKHILER